MNRSNADLPTLPQVAAVLAAFIVATAAGIGAYMIKDDRQRHDVALALTGGDPSRAPALFRRYGCAGCHEIPGVPGADGKVGGSLRGIRERVYIGGVVTNTPDNLLAWIVSPQSFSPRTAMPVTGINEDEARDIMAYLYEQ
jgi:cytochrome c2